MIVNCNVFRNEIIAEGINALNLLKSNSSFAIHGGIAVRHFPRKANYNINPELFTISDDLIIVFDSGITDVKILKQIANNCKDRRLVFYYWNPVSTSIHPDKIPERYEKWSYSLEDCRQYSMKYNSTFYFECFADNKLNYTTYTDICFIGKDKGRKKVLQNLKQTFENEGLTTNFYITATHPKYQRRGYQRKVSYKESLNITLGSTCILDYYADPKSGLSLRTMESIFLGKKLITNNITIKDFDFYNQNNIYIYGTEQRKLREFIESPKAEIDRDIINRYKFSNWFSRFGG